MVITSFQAAVESDEATPEPRLHPAIHRAAGAGGHHRARCGVSVGYGPGRVAGGPAGRGGGADSHGGGGRGGAVFTSRAAARCRRSARSHWRLRRRPRPGAGGLRAAGRAGPPAEPPLSRRGLGPDGADRSGVMVPGVPPASGAGRRRGAGAAGGGSDSTAPPCAAYRSAGGAGAAGPFRGVPGGAGVGAAPARLRRTGAALGRAGRGRRTGGGAACRPRTCAARARPRYIAGWRRRQLSSAARAAAAEVSGVPAGVHGGWLGDHDDHNNSNNDNDVNDGISGDGSVDNGSGCRVEDGGDGGGGGTGRHGAGGGGGVRGALAAVTGSGEAGEVAKSRDRER